MLYQVNLFYIISARATFFCVLFYTYQVQVLNLISLGTTMFLCVKDSLKIKNK